MSVGVKSFSDKRKKKNKYFVPNTLFCMPQGIRDNKIKGSETARDVMLYVNIRNN